MNLFLVSPNRAYNKYLASLLAQGLLHPFCSISTVSLIELANVSYLCSFPVSRHIIVKIASSC